MCVSAVEFRQVQGTVFFIPAPSARGGYAKGDIETAVHQYHLIEHEFELVPGNCVYTAENYEPPAQASSLLHNESASFESIEKVRMLERKYNAKVVFSHDCKQFKTLRLASQFYC